MGLFDRFFKRGINARVAEAKHDPDTVIIDVRSPEEYAEGHIEGTVNIPLERIAEAKDCFAGKHLLVHCASGARSDQAVAALKAAGVEDVENIGGIMSWTGPVVTGSK